MVGSTGEGGSGLDRGVDGVPAVGLLLSAAAPAAGSPSSHGLVRVTGSISQASKTGSGTQGPGGVGSSSGSQSSPTGQMVTSLGPGTSADAVTAMEAKPMSRASSAAAPLARWLVVRWVFMSVPPGARSPRRFRAGSPVLTDGGRPPYGRSGEVLGRSGPQGSTARWGGTGTRPSGGPESAARGSRRHLLGPVEWGSWLQPVKFGVASTGVSMFSSVSSSSSTSSSSSSSSSSSPRRRRARPRRHRRRRGPRPRRRRAG